MNVRFTLLPETLAVARLEGDDPPPSWARGSFVSLTRSHGELSVVCAEAYVPENVTAARGWRCLRAEGPFPLDAVGIASSFIGPLADAKISNLLIATYDTDYLLVNGAHLSRAIEVLEAAGHEVVSG
jgi:uncharacterized protein